MNLLLALWLVTCVAAVCIAFAIDEDVWKALAERIRNPRPSAAERYLMATEPLFKHTTTTTTTRFAPHGPDCDMYVVGPNQVECNCTEEEMAEPSGHVRGGGDG